MDDDTLLVEGADLAEVMEKLTEIMRVYLEVARRHHVTINLAQGKTEAVERQLGCSVAEKRCFPINSLLACGLAGALEGILGDSSS